MEKDRNPDELIKTPEKDAISVNQLETVAGGRSGGIYYNDFCILWKKVKSACMKHGYRTACCPVCGTPLPYLGHYGEYDEFECEYAAKDKLYCRNCHEASRSEDWVINKFN